MHRKVAKKKRTPLLIWSFRETNATQFWMFDSKSANESNETSYSKRDKLDIMTAMTDENWTKNKTGKQERKRTDRKIGKNKRKKEERKIEGKNEERLRDREKDKEKPREVKIERRKWERVYIWDEIHVYVYSRYWYILIV